MNLTTKILLFVIGILIVGFGIYVLLVKAKVLSSQASQCSSNSDCSRGACGRSSAANGAPKVCCSSGSVTTYGGYDYCSQLASGQQCWTDSMCGSGNCRGNSGGLIKGVCD